MFLWSRPCCKNHLSRHTQGAHAHSMVLGKVSGTFFQAATSDGSPQIHFHTETRRHQHGYLLGLTHSLFLLAWRLLRLPHTWALAFSWTVGSRLWQEIWTVGLCCTMCTVDTVLLVYRGTLLPRCMSSCLKSLFLRMGVFCKALCGANDGYDDCRWHASVDDNPMELTCGMDVPPFFHLLVDHCQRCDTTHLPNFFF